MRAGAVCTGALRARARLSGPSLLSDNLPPGISPYRGPLPLIVRLTALRHVPVSSRPFYRIGTRLLSSDLLPVPLALLSTGPSRQCAAGSCQLASSQLLSAGFLAAHVAADVHMIYSDVVLAGYLSCSHMYSVVLLHVGSFLIICQLLLAADYA